MPPLLAGPVLLETLEPFRMEDGAVDIMAVEAEDEEEAERHTRQRRRSADSRNEEAAIVATQLVRLL